MEKLFQLFDTDDVAVTVQPLGSGKINHTYWVQGQRGAYVLQEVNTRVFPRPDVLMQNIDRVTRHLAEQQPEGRNLQVIRTRSGELAAKVNSGFWRCYNYLEQTTALDVVATPKDAFAAAKGFGDFLYRLSDLPPDQVQPVLPDFHNVAFRVEQLDAAIREDRVGREPGVRDVWNDIKLLQTPILEVFQRIQSGAVPTRITHNDTKISNVLLDAHSLEPVAVVDLDTVMPGSALFDVGDMIRTFVCPVDENEPDLSKISIRADIFEALVAGYHEGTQGILTPTEKDMVVDAGKMLLFTQAIRFLTDYLNGDVYYKTDYPEQNLVRTKNQWKLLSLLVQGEKDWRSLVRKVFYKF
ncbi:MAG: aminoglycoside phosphotransferase family protein [Saprospiraceae bacterium]|jgi:Ser/Thr protein kinase RdoA (MazF antagonist)|nr:aminoglycoside phosphotransferase family protein [Saprospiraceae bacterium]